MLAESSVGVLRAVTELITMRYDVKNLGLRKVETRQVFPEAARAMKVSTTVGTGRVYNSGRKEQY